MIERNDIKCYYSNEDGCYLAEITRMPGCISDGQNEEEAIKNVIELEKIFTGVRIDAGDIQIKSINYDKEYDLLNYVIRSTVNSYGDQDSDNIITLRDINTNEITGYTVMNFKHICNNKSNEYDELQKLFDVESVYQKCES